MDAAEPGQRGATMAALAQLLYGHGANILDADQHTDPEQGLFVQRIEFEQPLRLALHQEPKVQGGLLALSVETGEVLCLFGRNGGLLAFGRRLRLRLILRNDLANGGQDLLHCRLALVAGVAHGSKFRSLG